MADFSHVDKAGNPTMVNVGEKAVVKRSATARAIVRFPIDMDVYWENGELRSPKGAVFQTAVIAGIMAAKKTGELIPLCHPIGLDNCHIDIQRIDRHTVQIDCTATVHAKTGVEMEALTGASLAALTVYDMCKALSHDIVIESIMLMEKTGGKKDFHRQV